MRLNTGQKAGHVLRINGEIVNRTVARAKSPDRARWGCDQREGKAMEGKGVVGVDVSKARLDVPSVTSVALARA